jgi:hypothetical protein
MSTASFTAGNHQFSIRVPPESGNIVSGASNNGTRRRYNLGADRSIQSVGETLALILAEMTLPGGKTTLIALLLVNAGAARASVTVLLEEPYGAFGGMNPTGHAAIYLSRVCAASPVTLRRCHGGEQGVVISRYHRISGYDWLAIPLLPYLYAVDRPEQVPLYVNAEDVAALRDSYRRAHLEAVAPDSDHGGAPNGDWTELLGEAYDRTIYAFSLPSTEQQDDEFIVKYNRRSNRDHFNILFRNCADFARQAVDFYYPHAVRRSFLVDAAIMTPKQLAKSFVGYSKRHRDLAFSAFVIPQVSGTIPRSRAVRGVLESLVKSKRYVVPLVSLAVLHPVFGGSLAFAWLDSFHFNPRRVAGAENAGSQAGQAPASIAAELEFGGDAFGTAQ